MGNVYFSVPVDWLQKIEICAYMHSLLQYIVLGFNIHNVHVLFHHSKSPIPVHAIMKCE